MKRLLCLIFALVLALSALAPAALAGGETTQATTAPAETAETTEATAETTGPAVTEPEYTGVAMSQAEKEALLAALYEAPIADIREALQLRLITCRELTQYYLDRIEAYNKEYNCFITICDNALEEADKRDALLAAGEGEGLLFGIPIVVKDNIHYAGYYTTNGCDFEKSKVSTTNATVVDNLLAEGAVILAKSNMDYMANSARATVSNTAGETSNAYNPDLASGGSSGGSAVATALNFAAAGIGTDTNSSVRIPAGLNGCVGLRPTAGLVPRDGVIVVNKNRDTVGAITKTVEDQAILLSAMTGDPSYVQNLRGDVLEGLRIGVVQELFKTSGTGIDKEIVEAFQNAIEELKSLGAEVVEVSFPASALTMDQADQVYAEAKEEARDKKGKLPEDFPQNKFEYLNMLYMEVLEENGISAVIFPTYQNRPQYSGVDQNGKRWDVKEQKFINRAYAISPATLCPEITVPIGYHSRGAGISMEIAAARGEDQLLLNIAYAYTTAFCHRVAPEGAPNQYEEAYTGVLWEMLQEYEAYLENPLPWQMPAEPEPEPTVPETTVPETTAEEPTVPETTVPATAPATQSAEEPPAESWWAVGAGAALAGAAVAAVAYRRARKRKHRRTPTWNW